MSSIFKRMEEALKCVIENITTKVSKAEKKKAFFLTGFEGMFANPLSSLFYRDVVWGMIGAVVCYLTVYYRRKHAKKFRHGVEYGSARWGSEKDMEP